MRDKVTRQCPRTTTFDEKGEPKRVRTEVPLLTSLTPFSLGQPGSPQDQQGVGRKYSDVSGGEGEGVLAASTAVCRSFSSVPDSRHSDPERPVTYTRTDQAGEDRLVKHSVQMTVGHTDQERTG